MEGWNTGAVRLSTAATLLAGISILGCSAPMEGTVDVAAAAFPADSNAVFRHYVVPAMSEIQRLPDAFPSDGVADGTVNIVAARDEYEPGSFVVTGARDLGKVKFSLGVFKNEKGDVFPAEDLDLKVIKVWFQNRNGWFSYFGDTGFKLLPELLLNDEDLIRVDEKKAANYARLTAKDGTTSELWINPPRQFNARRLREPWRTDDVFNYMREDFDDAKTLQPVTIEKNRFKQFFLTAHAKKDAKPGLYKGVVKVGDLGEIPVAIRVLDFVLPAPKAYQDPNKDFLVSGYSYICQDQVAERNGFDYGAVHRQLVAIFKNMVEHNQPLHMVRGMADNYAFDCIEAMREGGMRMDVIQAGATPIGHDGTPGADEAQRAHARRMADEFIRRYGHTNVYMGMGDEPSAAWFPYARPSFKNYQDAGLKFFIAGHYQVFHRAGYIYDWFNTATDPVDPAMTPYWNKMQNSNHVAWYAHHHTGTENPAFARRQNGLSAYLTGYTALCNYAHHLGPYDDDSTTYKPMVDAYGCHSGVIDTLQWEGFREGVDDIRYATLMTDLARKAQKVQDTKVRYVGGKAMEFLALLDVRSFDMYWARAEMIRFINELRPLVAPYDVKTEMKMATAEERAAATKRLEDGLAKALAEAKKGFATATDRGKTNDVHRKVAKVYKDFFRDTQAGDYLMSVGLWQEAARYYTYNDREKGMDALLKAVRSPEAARGGWDNECAFWQVAPWRPEALDRFETIFFSRFKPTDTNGLARAAEDVFRRLGRNQELLWQERFASHVAVYEKTKAVADRVGAPVPPDAAFSAYDAYMRLGKVAEARRALQAGLANASAKTNEVYLLKLALLSTDAFRGDDAAAALEKIRAFDAAEGRHVPPKDRVDAICKVGLAVQGVNGEAFERGLNEFRKSLYVPTPKKRYVVQFSEAKVDGPGDWDRLDVPETVYDRTYGGSMDFLTTDVTTGNRGEVGTSKEKFPPPTMKVVADALGLHFFVCTKDPKAGEVVLGTVGSGGCEAYIAPGANEPYVCMLMEQDQGKVGFFNTTYDTFRTRGIYDDTDPRVYRIERRVDGDRVITYLFLSWKTWALKVPKNGSVWDFENMFWSRAGSFCWNGTESIHGRSTWGELEFRLTDAQRREILKPLLASALAYFRDQKSIHKYGLFAHWKDKEIGDPAFFAAEVEPIEKKLDKYAEMIKPGMSDETVDFLAKEALPQMLDLDFEVQRRRTQWLGEKMMKK